MGTIASNLSYLAGTKAAIKQAIIDKNVEVLDTDTFRSYASKIGDIGGGGYPLDAAELHAQITADWPDITSIVENDTDNTYPHKCIWLLRNNSPIFDFTFDVYVKKVLLSDGTIYTSSFTDHEWGENTDPTITNYRWAILYMDTRVKQTDPRPISITYNSSFLSDVDFSGLFEGCYSLLTIPQINTYTRKFLPRMFKYCYSLLTIPQLNTSNIINFSNMFEGCYSLLTIPQLDVSAGENFYFMFGSCYSLQILPQLATFSGKSFGYMFVGCRSLQTISHLYPSTATNLLYVFSGCFSLQHIDISPTSWIFNNSISFGDVKYLSKASILGIFNNLPSLSGAIISIHTNTNNKLTATEKAIATNKGWTVSVVS